MQCDFLDYTGGLFGGYYCKKGDKQVDKYTINTYCDNSLKYRDCPIYNKNNSDCYLTTAMCNILGNEDNCYILDALRGFRDNYMKKDQNCLPLLEDYDVIGPKISCCLEKDPKNLYVANFMLDSYIRPAVTLIENGCYDDAIEIYKDMTLGLANYYGLDVSDINCNKVIGTNVTRKKEICFE